MKKTIFLFASLFLTFVLNAGNDLVYTNTSNLNHNEVELISSTPAQILLNVKLNAYSLKSVNINNQEAFIVSTPHGTRLLESGAPDLPKFTESVIISDLAKMKLKIVSSNYIEIDNINIAPSKGNLTRDIDPSSIPYSYGKVYSHDAFYPSDIAFLRQPYILRDYRGQTIVFTPFQYNPVTKTLRIYTEFSVEMTPSSGKSENMLYRTNENKLPLEEFADIYKNQFLNFNQSRYTAVGEDGEMLIICHPDFIEAMEPFVAWKIQRGMPTTLVDVTTIGNASAIKTYITNFYNNTNLSYVLLVGDYNFVPSMSPSSGDSDNAYGYITGNDSYPEVFVGRFSAETVPHVNTMVERTIGYELNPTISALYGKVTGIASNQGPGDDNEYDYEHIQNIQTDMTSYTYTDYSQFFDGSQGGLDAPGNPSATDVGTDVSAGTGAIVYTGHGSTTSWGTSGFSNSNVNALTNTNVYPFIWAVACVNGNFVGNTCFGEAWTRAANNNVPTGAVATLMSTINQSWNPPMCGQDEMVDILTESYSNNIKRSFGGLSMNGCMQMNDEYGASGNTMTDTWNCFGDPSVMVRTAIPTSLTVTHSPTTFIGTSSFQVSCTTEGALVALTIGNEILGTEVVAGGVANVTFPALNTIATITLTVTAYNKVPYVGTVDVVPNNGPYVIYNSIFVQDPTGNNNHLADYSENISLDLTLTNIGIEIANGVTGTLTTSDTDVTITSGTYSFGNIDSSAVISTSSAFSFTIADFIDDQHLSSFTLELTDNLNNTWSSSFSIELYAPVLSISFDAIDDAGQIENGRLDPGETVNLDLSAFNDGHSVSPEAICTVSSNSPYITLNNPSVNAGIIDSAGFSSLTTSITVSTSAPIGTLVDFTFDLVAADYTASLTIEKKVGLIVEDWETNDFSSFAWTNDATAPWTIVSTNAFEGNYMAKSGVISNNQTSTMTMSIETIADDSITFFRKVSCEPPGYYGVYDYLEFKIDGVSQDQWGGELDWEKQAYFLSTGSHVLKWIYSKDQSVSEGEDCAWVDFITLPPLDMNYAPLFSFNQDTVVTEYNSLMTLAIEAFDLNSSDVLSMGATNLPAWCSFTDNGNWTADLSGTPANADQGFTTIQLWLSDGIADTVYYSFVLSVVPPLSIDNFDEENNFTVYPNPANEDLTIKLNLQQSKVLNLSIYNVLGEMIWKVSSGEKLNSDSNLLHIDAGNFESGVYFIKLQTEKSELQQKIIITR